MPVKWLYRPLASFMSSHREAETGMAGVSSFAAERSSRETAWPKASRWFGRNESLLNLFTSSGLNQPFRVALSERQLPLKHMMGGQVSAGCGEGIPANHTCTCLPLKTSATFTRRLDTATRHRVHWKTSRQGNGSVKRISVGAKALCDG